MSRSAYSGEGQNAAFWRTKRLSPAAGGRDARQNGAVGSVVGSVAPSDPREPIPSVPDQSDAPVVWDPARRRFVDAPVHEQVEPARPGPARDERRFYVPAGTVAAPPHTPRPASTAAAGAGGAERRRGGPPPAEEGGAGAPPGSAGGARSTVAPPPPPPKRRRIRRRTIVILAIVVPVVLVAAGLLWAQLTFNKIEKVAVGDLLDSGGPGTNYLIVGSDSREGVDPDDPNAGAIVGEGAPGGQRSDTMLVLRIQGGHGTMLSVPRDLYVTMAETGQRGRINSAYNGGPRRLIQTVKDNLGIPIHRYIEVDFVTFAKLVDAVGGVTIDFPYPGVRRPQRARRPGGRAGGARRHASARLRPVPPLHRRSSTASRRPTPPATSAGSCASSSSCGRCSPRRAGRATRSR